MIRIEEREHKKLSGINSLFISFNYNQKIIDTIKSCEVFSYDKGTKEWEVLITSLAHLIDTLTFIDDIDLVLAKEESKDLNKPILTYKTPLFKHQLEAVEYGLNHDKFLLLDSPGLGKSLSIIALAEELKAQRNIEHCLIICGINTLKTNWEKEIKRHSNLDSIIIGKRVNRNGNVVYESMQKRGEQLKNKINEFFVIVNIESLREDYVIDCILNSCNSFDMIVLDEAHKCASQKAQQTKGLFKLDAQYLIAMTGTLLTNSPLSCYVPLAWVGVEKRRNLTNFKKTFCIFDERVLGGIAGYKNLDLLQKEIESCSLRRTKDLLNLPPKNIINEFVDMSDSHRTFYNSVKNGVKEDVDKVELNPANVLALITRLRQATSCPSVLTTNSIQSTKIERCLNLVEEIVSNGDKVVIFSMFKEPIYELRDLLDPSYKVLIGTGDMKDEEVSKNVDKFQENPSNKVFLGTIQKMGTGVTLTSACYMIFIDLPYTEALYEQACDRIHRIGSTKPIFIYNLICNDTIDEEILKIIEKKRALSDYVVDNKLDDVSIATLKKYVQGI